MFRHHTESMLAKAGPPPSIKVPPLAGLASTCDAIPRLAPRELGRVVTLAGWFREARRWRMFVQLEPLRR